MRQRHTHWATVYGERKVGENELGNDQTVTDDSLIEFPCRLESTRHEADLDESGARINTEPFVVAPLYGRDPDQEAKGPAVMETVEVGHDLAVAPAGWDSTNQHYRVVSVNMYRGRSNAPQNVRVQLAFYGGA